MDLESAFQDLLHRVKSLRDALSALQIAVEEDRPRSDDVALVDILGGFVDDLLGCLEGPIRALDEASLRAIAAGDLDAARRALAACQAFANRAIELLLGELASYGRIASLRGVARRRGGEWGAWARCVEMSVQGCQQPLYELNRSLLSCWRGVVDRVVMTVGATTPAAEDPRRAGSPPSRSAVEVARG
jgi:hypothetical protein